MDISELTIAVIEPSAMQGKLIESELKKLGISKVIYQDCGQAALASMHNDTPDLVISAMYLPDMTGAELVKAMREDSILEGVPFMLISSESKFSMLDPIRQAGVVAILPKPFDPGDLRKALYSTVEFISPDENALADIALDNLKTLVVDDSPLARKHISRVLGNLGIRDIATAENGMQALKLIESTFFDLVVTDYNMPEMDGENLTRFIREHSTQHTALHTDPHGDQRRRPKPSVRGTAGGRIRHLRQTLRHAVRKKDDRPVTRCLTHSGSLTPDRNPSPPPAGSTTGRRTVLGGIGHPRS